MDRGLLVVISAPSGAGKTTLAHGLMAAHPDIRISTSHTTRPPRPGDRDGVDYYFVSDETFEEMVTNDAFEEWAWVHDHRYGTSSAEVERLANTGAHVLFDVDYQGGIAIMDAHPEAISIFILPPGLAELEDRIRRRGTDTHETIERRVANARREMEHYDRYHYTVVNDDLDRAQTTLNGIFTSQLHRTGRMKSAYENVLKATQ